MSGDDVLRGIRAGEYCLMLGRDEAAETLRVRAERFGAGDNPTAPGHSLLPT